MMTRDGSRCRRPLDESGSALVIALVVMSLMLALGLAALAMTDQQTAQSRSERVRESSFNLAEGALQQQSFQLGGRGWPRLATDALPAACNESSDPGVTTNRRCPTPSALVSALAADAGTSAYDEADYEYLPEWTTHVRDNTSAGNKVYTSAVDAQARWDANADGFLWVKSTATVGAKTPTATVGAKTRTIVALLKRDPIPILLRKAVLVAGALEVGQGGQPGVIRTDATTPPVLRCAGYGGDCADYKPSTNKKEGQILPDTVTYNPGFPNLVPADTVSKLVDSATVFTDCPDEAEAQGFVVIDLPSDAMTCEFTGNTNFNSTAAPGFLIMRRGTLRFAGNGQFYGLILHLNEAGRDAALGSEDCVRITGTLNIFGGLVVEGKCGAFISGNARLTFSPNNLNFSVTGVAGLVQNTWRELPPS